MKPVDLRLRDMDPKLMWTLKQIAASRHMTLRAYLIQVLQTAAAEKVRK